MQGRGDLGQLDGQHWQFREWRPASVVPWVQIGYPVPTVESGIDAIERHGGKAYALVYRGFLGSQSEGPT